MKNSLYLIVIVFGALILLSVFSEEFVFYGIELKKPDVISDILTGNVDTLSEKNIVILDSMYLEDTSKTFVNYIKDFSKDSLAPLQKFSKSLKKAEKKTAVTRIAFLGDSMIEGDLVSQTLRYKLQKKFGGAGVGYVPITSQTADFRKTIRHKFSSNWKILSILNDQGDKSLGLSGFVFRPAEIGKSSLKAASEKNKSGWVSYKPVSDVYENLDHFFRIKLFYGKTDPENFVIFKSQKKQLSGKSQYNQLILNDSSPVNSADIDFYTSSQTDIYGFSFESPEGVFVDNYSVRGNSGIPLVMLSKPLLKSTDSVMKYNLIILQYGLNIAEPNTKDLTFYSERLIPAVKHLQEAFPDADILIMSVSDKCYKKGGSYVTEPSIPLIVEEQKKIARETGCLFWNLFEAMGGKNSMNIWVKNNLANKDYTHFNYAGAEKVGTFLYNQLMYHYLNYLKSNKDK